MQPRFSKKDFLIPGGNSGIGLASARAFAAELDGRGIRAPFELARAVFLLASPEASCVTGIDMLVSGGAAAL